MRTLLTFDLETENNTLNKRKASPFDKRNYIVQAGWSINGGKAQEEYYNEWHRKPVLPIDVLDNMGKGDLFIGFNTKFDLLWTWEEPALQAALKRGAEIYCGQYTEYLLGGHVPEVQMCAMNDIAEQYGGGCKIDAVKEMWEAGVLTSEIPRDLLTDYLIGDGKTIVGDVMNTWLIFKGQVARMNKEHPTEFKTMLKHRMDGLLATTEIEYNGIFVNRERGETLRTEVVTDLEKAVVELDKFIPELPKELEFKWSSIYMKSALLYGGTTKYQKWVAHLDEEGNNIYVQKTSKFPRFNKIEVNPSECEMDPITGIYSITLDNDGTDVTLVQDTYLSGKKKGQPVFVNVKEDDLDKPKGALQDFYYTFNGYVEPKDKWLSTVTDAYDNPIWSTAADTIEELQYQGLPFTDALCAREKLNKVLGTYFWTKDKHGKKKGMLSLVGEDGIVHGKVNHTSTVTSRLSANDPNCQNLPRKDTSKLKQVFTSRFGSVGAVAEVDYSQLEVVIQAVLSNDTQMREDLNNSVDFHCKRLALKLDEDYKWVWEQCHKVKEPSYKLERTSIKQFSFQRAYGAGVNAVVASTGMAKEEVEAIIANEEKEYPYVVEFDKTLEKHITQSRRDSGGVLFVDGVVFKRGEGVWDSPTGTRYIWREGITPKFMHKHGKFVGFSPTERKNYPVQGFGGEVVQTMLGKLFRHLLENDRYDNKVLLVNTVHDCYWLDGVEEVLMKALPEIKKVVEDVPNVFNTSFDKLNIDVPFPTETEVGYDMYDMEEL